MEVKVIWEATAGSQVKKASVVVQVKITRMGEDVAPMAVAATEV